MTIQGLFQHSLNGGPPSCRWWLFASLVIILLLCSCNGPHRTVVQSVCFGDHCFQVIDYCYPGNEPDRCGTEVYRVDDTGATAFEDGDLLFRHHLIRLWPLTTLTDSLLRIPIVYADWPDPEIIVPINLAHQTIDSVLTPDRSRVLWSMTQGRFAVSTHPMDSTHRTDTVGDGVALYISDINEAFHHRTVLFPGAESVMMRFEDEYTLIVSARWAELPKSVFRFRIALWRVEPGEMRLY